MSFWNNPENNSLKVIIIVVVLALAGFFSYKYMHQNALSEKGTVIDMSTGTGPSFTFSSNTTGSTCTLTVTSVITPTLSITLQGTTNSDSSCTLNPTQSTPQAQGLYAILNP